MEKPDLRSLDPLVDDEGVIDPQDVGLDLEPELVDEADLVEAFELSPGAAAIAPDLDFRAVDEVRSELERQLADTRGELGARIAELEGELEAIREERAEWTRELDDLEAELLQRATLLAETRASAEQLRDALAELDQERIRLVSQVAHLQHDRERIQDDLAAQISQLASDLAIRDQEIARIRRDTAGPAAATSCEAHEAEIARLKAELEDLAGENEFLNSELDRYAAMAMERGPA